MASEIVVWCGVLHSYERWRVNSVGVNIVDESDLIVEEERRKESEGEEWCDGNRKRTSERIKIFEVWMESILK